MPLDDRTGGYHAVEPSSLFFRPCEASDLTLVAEIEANSYPADEAASPRTSPSAKPPPATSSSWASSRAPPETAATSS